MELSKAVVLPQVVHRTSIQVTPYTVPVKGGNIERFQYRFTVTLDNGQVHEVTGTAINQRGAFKAALNRSGRMVDKGYEQ